MSEKRRKRLINKPLGMLSTRVLLGLLILLGTVTAGADSSVYVPLDTGFIALSSGSKPKAEPTVLQMGIKPYSRNKIIELLDEIR